MVSDNVNVRYLIKLYFLLLAAQVDQDWPSAVYYNVLDKKVCCR